MQVTRMIVHHIDKAQFEENAVVDLRESLLPVDDRAIQFMEQVEHAYLRYGRKSYGVFSDDRVNYPFQTQLSRYMDNPTDASFLQFSKDAAGSFRTVLDRTRQASGGYLFLVDFQDDEDRRRFATIVLTDRSGLAIDPDTLELRTNLIIDMEHLNMGVRVKVDDWQAETEQGTYLSFLQGRKLVTNYFSDFIGCQTLQSSREATKNLRLAVSGYLDSQGKTEQEQTDVMETLYERLRTWGSVTVDAVANFITPDDPDSFKQYIVINEIEINDGFSPHKGELKRFVFKEYTTNDLKIRVSQKLITSRVVEYRDQDQTVVVHDNDGTIRRSLFPDADQD